jgi:hypothetical protein
MSEPFYPTIRTRCADCGLGTNTANEWYMVNDAVWQQAWAGRLKPHHALPGQQILCIGCLEARIGRRLWGADFPDVPVNDFLGEWYKSDRLLDRMGADKIQTMFHRARRDDDPGAKAWCRWLTREVLPTIRRTGRYP